MEKRPELFAACLICSSQWNGAFENLIKSQTPIYFVIGENDEYYGSKPFIEAYTSLRRLYQQQGLSDEKIEKLLVLDVKSNDYFASKGKNNQHGDGASLFASEHEIMSWLFMH